VAPTTRDGRAPAVLGALAALALSGAVAVAVTAIDVPGAAAQTVPGGPGTSGPGTGTAAVFADCDPPPEPPTLVFDGTAVAVGVRSTLFALDRVIVGRYDDTRITVQYDTKGDALEPGVAYRVAAIPSATGSAWRSALDGECITHLTTMPDGSAVDTDILRGLDGNWDRVALAVAGPLAVAVIALALVAWPVRRLRRRREAPLARWS
jgi:hypothetical protein